MRLTTAVPYSHWCADDYVSIELDETTDAKGRHVVNIFARRGIKSYLVQTLFPETAMTADKLYSILIDTERNLHLADQTHVIAVITDGASYNQKGMARYKAHSVGTVR